MRETRVAAHVAAIRAGATPNVVPQLVADVVAQLRPRELAAYEARLGRSAVPV